MEMDREAFESLVGRALDQIPDQLASLVRNVVVLVEDEPPEDASP
jgi:predicted Zn-dependent protease with MMP-like domain